MKISYKLLSASVTVLGILAIAPVTLPNLVSSYHVQAAATTSVDKIDTLTDQTTLGVDLTDLPSQSLAQLTDWQQTSLTTYAHVMSYLKGSGITTISMKVAVTPSADYLSLDAAKPVLAAAQAAGLKTNVVLLYSDAMTYATTQTPSTSWSTQDVETAAETYTTTVLNDLKAANLTPNSLTLGHEINWNFLGLAQNQGWEALAKISQLATQALPTTTINLGLALPNQASDINYLIQALADAKVSYSGIASPVYANSTTEQQLVTDVTTRLAAHNKNFLVSDFKQSRSAVSEQTQAIRNTLAATTGHGRGGLIYDEALDRDSDNSLVSASGAPLTSLGTFRLVQGLALPATTTTDSTNSKSDNSTSSLKMVTKVASVANVSASGTTRAVNLTSYLTSQSDKTLPIAKLLPLLKEAGVNTIALTYRLDMSAALTKQLLALAQAAQAQGFKLDLVLAFTDSQDKNQVPTAWQQAYDHDQQLYHTGLTALYEHATQFTTNTLTTFKKAGITPATVTVGQAVDWNLLGASKDDLWSLYQGITEQIRNFDASIKIALDFNLNTAKNVSYLAEALDKNDVDYDIFGVSFYPDFTTNETLAAARDDVVKTYGKQFWVTHLTAKAQVQTGQTSATVSPQTQANTLHNAFSASVSAQNAGGVVYDDAVNLGAYDALFAKDGTALSSLATFKQVIDPQAKSSTTSKSTFANKDPYETGQKTDATQQKANVDQVATVSQSTMRGVDLSSYQALVKAGVQFYDFNGQPASLLKIMADNGVNYVRLRIWNDPKDTQGRTYGGGDSTLENAIKTGQEATKYGMKVLVDLHYSDFWASPSVEITPKAWAKMSYEQQKQAVYDYTTKVMNAMKAAGVDVGMVQIGNETTRGLMDYHVSVDDMTNPNWDKMAGLIQAGSAAVRKTMPETTKVAVHFESPTPESFQKIAQKLKDDKVDYDVFGATYYPFWNGTLDNLADSERFITDQFGKEFAVLEYSYLYTTQDSDGQPNNISGINAPLNGSGMSYKPYDISPQGQANAIHDILKTVTETSPKGLGSFYWEPAWIAVHPGSSRWNINKATANKYGTGWASEWSQGYFPENRSKWWGASSWDNQTLFDDQGHPLQSLKAFSEVINPNAVDHKDSITLAAVITAHQPVAVYDEQSKLLADTLKTGYQYYTNEQITINHKSYYKIGPNRYVLADEVTVTDYAPTIQALSGTAIISASSTPLYNLFTSTTDRSVSRQTQWKVLASMTVGKTTYYKVGASQYIKAQDAIFVQAPDRYLTVQGLAQVKSTATLYTNTGTALKRLLSKKSQWKVLGQLVRQGQTYYQVGADQFVRAQEVNFTDLTPRIQPAKGIAHIKTTQAAVYTQSGDKTRQTLPAQTNWRVTSAVTVGQTLYYQVGRHQYLAAKDVEYTGTQSVSGVVQVAKKAAFLYDEQGQRQKQVLPANSRWKTVTKLTLRGTVYYQVGAHTYLKESDLASFN